MSELQSGHLVQAFLLSKIAIESAGDCADLAFAFC